MHAGAADGRILGVVVANERIYLAGPDVFLPDPVAMAEAKKAICAAHGFVGVFPLDKDLDLSGLSPAQAGHRISRANEDLMRTCDLIVANMTPFRGPSMDVGTAYEMGFMRALGRPVLGYTCDGRLFAERTRAWIGIARGVGGHPHGDADADGMLIEDFAMVDNLMLHGAVVGSHGAIETDHVAGPERFTALAAFTRSVVCARELLG
ncbi:MAG: nucleoside 2-deoxyribosyltransferase [Alphaproteobacteria bacterium]